MANAWFNHAKHLCGTGGLDLATAATAGNLKVLLVCTGWSFSSHKDDDQLSDLQLATYEYNGTNYSRKALANASWVKDATNNRSELHCDPTVWALLGQAAAGQMIAAIIYLDNAGGDTLRIPIAKIDDGGFPKDGTGADATITWDSEGALQAA